MSLGQYNGGMRKLKQQQRVEAKAAKLAKFTIQCECGRWLLGPNDHANHIRSQGKKSHKVAVTREAQKEGLVDWAIF
ncbi:MAG: hypothetical protein ABSH24_37230 [Bryobacteraceae bacterium]|jgi:hypothetical protein